MANTGKGSGKNGNGENAGKGSGPNGGAPDRAQPVQGGGLGTPPNRDRDPNPTAPSGTLAGRELNSRYALISVVGGGGMAQVYKARDNILGRVVAVKVLREQYTSDQQFVARFRREAQAAANLAHPNIVNVYDVGQDGDLHYIVMEFIAGRSLKDLIERAAPLPVDRAVNIAAQILAGLEYAHRSGLIHRDIKPQNVLITQDGVVKVTDFGIAKSVSDLGLTEAGLALGTAHYFSPEQARGERVVPQSDIYAVGVTLFEMLTGRLPFESENAVGLAYKHIGEPPPSPRALNPGIPARLDAIVLKALAKDPAQRYTSAAEMERVLRSLQIGGQQPTVEMPVQVPAARPNLTQPGRQVSARGPRTGRIGPSGAPTGPVRASAAATTAATGAAVSARHITSPLGAPASVALRPSSVRVQSGSGGCSVGAIAILMLGIIAILVGAAVVMSPQLGNLFTEVVVPSPTATATVPTPTPSHTPVPPTLTPTSTPTLTPTPTATPQSVPVPLLVGLSVNDATVLAKQKGFVLYVLEEVESVEYPTGIVVQQDPPAEAIYQQTHLISVRVSKGPPPFALPDLAFTDPDQARSVLEGAGLKVTIVRQGSDSVPKGVVIGTQPPAGQNVRPGDTVRLLVSMGETAKVPNLLGVENADIARQRLEGEGLVLANVSEEDDPTESVPPGAVLRQNPPAGIEVEKGSPVDIVVRRR